MRRFEDIKFVLAWLFPVLLIAAGAIVAVAQNTVPTSASTADQARIKPYVDAETKAREALLAKTSSLPESAKVKAAKEAYDKAVAELNTAAEKLPEHEAWKLAGAKALDEAYRILADNKLSSREYRPELNSEGKLVFARITPPR